QHSVPVRRGESVPRRLRGRNETRLTPRGAYDNVASVPHGDRKLFLQVRERARKHARRRVWIWEGWLIDGASALADIAIRRGKSWTQTLRRPIAIAAAARKGGFRHALTGRARYRRYHPWTARKGWRTRFISLSTSAGGGRGRRRKEVGDSSRRVVGIRCFGCVTARRSAPDRTGGSPLRSGPRPARIQQAGEPSGELHQAEVVERRLGRGPDGFR